MITTFQRGKSGSGKTVLLSAMAKYFSLENTKENGFHLNIRDFYAQSELTANMQGLTKKMKFPKGTIPGQSTNFEFEVLMRQDGTNIVIPELNFRISDYAGGDLSKDTDLSDELRQIWDTADQKVYVIDGFILLHDLEIVSNSDPNLKFGELDINKPESVIDELTLILGAANSAPIAFVITKWDYVKKHINFEELLRQLLEQCPALKLAPKNSLIIPISSIGDNNTEDELISNEEFIDGENRTITRLFSKPKSGFKFKPENLDVLLAFIFKRFTENEVNKIDGSYEKLFDDIKNSSNESAKRIAIAKLESSIKNQGKFGRFLDGLKSIVGNSKQQKLSDERRELQREIDRLKGEIKAVDDQKKNDVRLNRFNEILNKFTDVYNRFVCRYNDSLITGE